MQRAYQGDVGEGNCGWTIFRDQVMLPGLVRFQRKRLKYLESLLHHYAP